MDYLYKTRGTCSQAIQVNLDREGIIREVVFIGGCDGNLCGISKLVMGRSAKEVIQILRGTRCGPRSTSCPDQLTYALEEALNRR
jgi:uncharacterized protein (TIGR03905 family)